MPKLTLSAKEDIIQRAKQLARERGTSVSALFSEFIDSAASDRPRPKAAPITRRLRGLAKVSPEKTDRELFERALLDRTRR
jgi:hypothetical protein